MEFWLVVILGLVCGRHTVLDPSRLSRGNILLRCNLHFYAINANVNRKLVWSRSIGGKDAHGISGTKEVQNLKCEQDKDSFD